MGLGCEEEGGGTHYCSNTSATRTYKYIEFRYFLLVRNEDRKSGGERHAKEV